MIASLFPIWLFDFVANILIMGFSAYLVISITLIIRMRPNRPLWMYLQWQVIALAVFALSHSVGHVLKRILVLMGHRDVWESISPYTGSVNSISFVVVAILTFLYKDVESASDRIGSLEQAKQELEVSGRKLQDSYRKMELDAEEILLKNRELSTLNKVAMAVSKSLEMDRVIPSIIEAVKDLLDAAYLGIYLIEGDKAELKAWGGLCETARQDVAQSSLEEPWFKDEVLAGKTYFARERTDESLDAIPAAVKALGTQSCAAVPITTKGKVLGVLYVWSSKYDGIDTRQLDTLTTIGGYVGVVIETSMLYEELKQKVEDLERFRKFSVGREMRIIELKERLKGHEGTE